MSKQPTHLHSRYFFSFILTVPFWFAACENQPAEVQEVIRPNERVNYPLNEQHNAVFRYTDSGKAVLEIHAGLVEDYTHLDPKYMSFKRGVEVRLFNKQGTINTTLRADTAQHMVEEQRWNIGGQVVVINKKGERLETQQLFWDEKAGTLRSEKRVQITTDGQLITGTGFEADKEFASYRIFNVQGEITIDDE